MVSCFSIDEFDVLRTGTAEYFVRRVRGAVRVLRSRCPHRGGPLRLGRWEGDEIVCPWHQTRTRAHRCIERRMPSVWRAYSREILVVGGESEQGPLCLIRSNWLPECSTPAESGTIP